MLSAAAPYLTGGLGIAIGVIVALVYANRYTKLKGAHDLLASDHAALKENNLKLAVDHKDQTYRMEAEIGGLRAREAKTRDEIRVLLDQCNDPVVLNNKLNRMFPISEEVPVMPPVPRSGSSDS